MSNTIQCPICEDYNKNVYIYASSKTSDLVHTEAHNRAILKIQQLGILEQYYFDFYIMFYRIEYKELYDTTYNMFKCEYKYTLIEKYSGKKNVCEYHYRDYLVNLLLPFPLPDQADQLEV